MTTRIGQLRSTVAGLVAGAIALILRQSPRRPLISSNEAVRESPGRRLISSNEAVVTYHQAATDAGLEILGAGGNAFDAFIAATMAEYVVAEGGTSLAGPLGVLIYDAKRRKIEYLDAEFNEVLKPKGRWRSGEKLGKAMLVPGAPAGLEALSRRYGRLTFARCLAPAIRLAREGFAVDPLYCRYVELNAGLLRTTSYGKRTFFRDGLAPDPGELLRQPELATLLEQLAGRGADYMYRGRWAVRFVDAVRRSGGLVTLDDMKRYRATWHQPWQTTYRDHTLYACSGRTFGGLWTMVCLKALEHTDLRALGHWSRSAEALEILIRTIRRAWAEFWLLDYRLLEDPEFVQARLSATYGARLWRSIAARRQENARPMAGSHSYHIIVRDKDGNLASGTNTHESLAWGAGIFVDGVPLPASGYLPWNTNPGERRISPFAMLLAFKDERLRFATGSFSSSILEASLQFILNLVDYECSAHDAVTLPRVGTYPHNPADYLSAAAAELREDTLEEATNWLDSRIPAKLVSVIEHSGVFVAPGAARRRRAEKRCAVLRARGLPCRRAEIDTGLGTVLEVTANGIAKGAIAPWPGASTPEDAPADHSAGTSAVNTAGDQS